MEFNKLRQGTALPELTDRGYGIKAGRDDVVGFNQTVTFETGLSFAIDEGHLLVVNPPTIKGLQATYSGADLLPPADGVGKAKPDGERGELLIHLTNISRDAFYVHPETMIGFVALVASEVGSEPSWSDPDENEKAQIEKEKAKIDAEHKDKIAEIDRKLKEPRVKGDGEAKGGSGTKDVHSLKGPALHAAILKEVAKRHPPTPEDLAHLKSSGIDAGGATGGTGTGVPGVTPEPGENDTKGSGQGVKPKLLPHAPTAPQGQTNTVTPGTPANA